MSAGRPELDLGQHGKVTVKKQDDGRWKATTRYRHPLTGKTSVVTRTGATFSKANVALQNALAEKAGPAGKAADLTVAELMALYIPKMTQAVQTQSRYRSTIRNAIIPAIGNIRLRELSKSKVVSFIKGVPTASEQKTSRAVLRGALELALELDAVPENYAAYTGLRIADPNRKETRALSIEGVEAVLDLITTHGATKRTYGPQTRKKHIDLGELFLIQLAAGGIRPGEAAAILVDDMDFEKGTVFVRRTIIYREPVKNKEGKIVVPGGYEIQDHTKAADRVIVRLPKYALDILRRRSEDPGESGLLFHTLHKDGQRGGPLNLNNTRFTMRQALKGTPYEGWTSLHTARRTLGTLATRDPLHGITVAQKILRHRSVGTTISSYVEPDINAPDVRNITERFSR
jgi:integrase